MSFSTAALRLTLLLWFGICVRGFEVDLSTSGNWHHAYGGEGHRIHEGPENWPSSLSFSLEGASPWLWTKVTGLPNALAWVHTRGGVASCWYSPTSFTVKVGNDDGVTRRFAFYFLDFDTSSRVQRVERLDPKTGAVLAEGTLSDFHNGKYLVVQAAGPVKLRLTRLAGYNAVLSGVFIGGALQPQEPSAQVTQPYITPFGGDYTAPLTITMNSPTEGAVVLYTLNGSDPRTSGTPYIEPFTIAASATVRAIGRRDGWRDSAETVVTYNIVQSSSGAEFVGLDPTTQGSWIGAVGETGYHIPMFAPYQGAYGFGFISRPSDRWVWQWASTAPPALQKPPEARTTERFAACWYGPDTVSFRIDVDQGREFMFSVYALDWDSAGRVQRFEIVDAATGGVLDSREVGNFAQGVYLKWRIGRSVLLRVTRLAGPNAVVSGIFMDSTGEQRVAAPTFRPGGGPDAYNGLVTVWMETATPDAQIRYTSDGSTPTEASPLYDYPITLYQTTTLKAVAFKPGLAPSSVTSEVYTIAQPPGTFATFVNRDTTTRGSWRTSGQYGTSAYAIIGDRSNWTWSGWKLGFQPVAGATVADHYWAFNVTEHSALEKATSPERLAACRYSAQGFTVTVESPVGGSVARRVSLYFLDWDHVGRVQLVEAIDLEGGAVLDRREVSGITTGAYYSWNVHGRVGFRITPIFGPNAVVSGVFLD